MDERAALRRRRFACAYSICASSSVKVTRRFATRYLTSLPPAAGMPTVAIVGRPNVGKSTLFNRMVGSRRAIVGDEPGITRDRLYGEAEWRGRHFRMVDTGGIIPEEKDFIPAEIFRQAKSRSKKPTRSSWWWTRRTEMPSPILNWRAC